MNVRFIRVYAFLDVLSLLDDEFLDKPMTSKERVKAAERIQPKWRIFGRILRPEPFADFEIYAFEEKRTERDRALDMLDAWAKRFGKRATRRHFIYALEDTTIGYSDEVAAIFSGSFLVLLRVLLSLLLGPQ